MAAREPCKASRPANAAVPKALSVTTTCASSSKLGLRTHLTGAPGDANNDRTGSDNARRASVSHSGAWADGVQNLLQRSDAYGYLLPCANRSCDFLYKSI